MHSLFCIYIDKDIALDYDAIISLLLFLSVPGECFDLQNSLATD